MHSNAAAAANFFTDSFHRLIFPTSCKLLIPIRDKGIENMWKKIVPDVFGGQSIWNSSRDSADRFVDRPREVGRADRSVSPEELITRWKNSFVHLGEKKGKTSAIVEYRYCGVTPRPGNIFFKIMFVRKTYWKFHSMTFVKLPQWAKNQYCVLPACCIAYSYLYYYYYYYHISPNSTY